MKKGIYLVANLKSEAFCENLIYSIRNSGCKLPIRLIHFGGEKLVSPYILNEVEFLTVDDFPKEAIDFINLLRSELECPLGFLYRFLAWFSDWDEFIYSDNDIVALSNWEHMFDFLPGYDLVNADEEYTTKGCFNHDRPDEIERIFGAGALEKAITAGHFAARRSPKMVADMTAALHWVKENRGIAKKHDQSLMHVALLLGEWKALNLCKPPHNWLSSWAGDYKNPLALVLSIQAGPVDKKVNISHLHYSGFSPKGEKATDIFLYSNMDENSRLTIQTKAGFEKLSGLSFIKFQKQRVERRIKRMWHERKK